MRNVSLGITLKIAQTLAFSLMYAAIKLAGHASIGEVVFFRAFFAFVPLLAWTVFTVGPAAAIRTQRPLYHVYRSAVGVTAMFFNFSAVKLLTLASVTAFSFMQPIFAVILAALFLGEHVGRYRWGAVIVGFLGVLMMIEPHGGLASLLGLHLSRGVAYALAFSLFSAAVVVLIRQMSVTERGEAIVFYFMASCTVAGAAVMLWDYVPLTWNMVLWLVLCGLVGGAGQIFMTYCYRYAEPSVLAPFDYISMIWATLLGYFVLAEVPEAMVLGGAGVVIAAGMFIVWREHRLHVERPPAAVT
jgi:drug/metabolite transporter (DMT)-like permease